MIYLPTERLQDEENIHSFFPQEEHESKSQFLYNFFTVRHRNVGNVGVFFLCTQFFSLFFTI